MRSQWLFTSSEFYFWHQQVKSFIFGINKWILLFNIWIQLLNAFQESFDFNFMGNAASMVNRISCNKRLSSNSSSQQLTTDTTIEVTPNKQIHSQIINNNQDNMFGYKIIVFLQVIIEIPFAFRAIPVGAIESAGTQVLEQLLRLMLPRFLRQVQWF